MIVMLVLVKLLQALSGIVSILAVVLAASGEWLILGTSMPLIIATIAASIHYRPDLIAISRSNAWRRRGFSEVTGAPPTKRRSSG